MTHPDALIAIAEQRGRDLRIAAHRRRLQRYDASFRRRGRQPIRAALHRVAALARVPRLRSVPAIGDDCCVA